MARPLKIFLGLIGLLVALVVIAAIAIPLLVNPNDYRDEISQSAKTRTGRELTVGDIGLAVFPWLKVTLKDVQLANAEGFGDEPFLTAAEASVGVRLWPLLTRQRYEVSTIGIRDAAFNLERDKSGKSNWEDLGQDPETSASDNPDPADEKAPDQGSKDIGTQLGKVQLGGIDIANASVSFDDRQAEQSYQLRELNLTTGPLKLGQAFDLESSGMLSAKTRALDAGFTLKARIDPDLEGKRVAVDNLKLGIETSEAARRIVAELTGKLRSDLSTGMVEVSELVVTAKASGEAIPGGAQEAKLSGALSLNRTEGTARLTGLVLEALNLKATAELTGSGLNAGSPSFSGPIAIQPFSPRELLSRLGRPDPQSSDPSTLSKLAFNATLNASDNSASFNDLKLVLDQTSASGTLAIRNFDTQRLEFDLDIDEFDADRYLPPKPEGREERKEQREERPVNDTEIDVTALQALNLQGTLDVGRLKLRGLDMSQVRVRVDGPSGEAKRARLQAQMFGGSIDADTAITPATPSRFTLKSDIKAVQLAPLMLSVTGKERLSGTGNILLDLTSSGTTVGELRQGLNGTVSVELLRGALKGFNLGSILRRGQASLRGQNYQDEGEQETDFASIQFKGEIKDGVLSSDFLDGRSPLFRAAGSGRVDLFNETIDYTARPTVVETSKGQGGKGLEDLAGITVPVRITGSWSDPKYRLDLEEALKQKAADRLREGLKGREGELLEKLDGRLGNALEGLLGNRRKAAPAEDDSETPPAEEGDPP